jgi:dTDP-4-dehydrorhamnose reductase
MRTLLIGASGQVGHALAGQFAGDELVTASHQHARAGDLQLDLGDAAAVRRALADVRPDLVLVAGAMCNAELAETERDMCERINTLGPAAVAEYAHGSGARVVYFSSDHVFDGAQERYVESDAMHPLYVYAATKARGEEAIRAILPERHLIVRTGWVYGPDAERRNFALRLVDRITAGETVTVPGDQWGCPTYTDDLARATRHLVDRGLTGTFHATGPDFVDRGTLAFAICDQFGLDRGRVAVKPTRELGQVARRSLRVRLDCGKLHSAGAPAFRGVADGLRALAAAQAASTTR